MFGAILSQIDSSRCSLGRCSITFDDKPNNYYLYKPSDDTETRSFEITKEADPARDLIAIISGSKRSVSCFRCDCLLMVSASCPWTISLEIFSEVRIHTQGWGPKEDSVIKLMSVPGKTSSIFLRPNDVFQIGNVTLQVLSEKRNPEIQVTSSGNNEAVEDRKDNNSSIELKPGEVIELPLPEKPSTPRKQSSEVGSASEFDTTIMETPAASHHYNPDLSDSSLMFTSVEHGMKDDEEKSKAVLPSTRGVSELEDKAPLQAYLTTAEYDDDKTHVSYIDGPGLQPPEDIVSTFKQKVILDMNATRNSNDGDFALPGPQAELLQPEENVLDIASGVNPNTEDLVKSPVEMGNVQSPIPARMKRGPRKRKRPAGESQGSVESLNHEATSPTTKGNAIGNQPLKYGTDATKQNTKKPPVNSMRDLSEPPPSASARSTKPVQLREHSPLSSSMTGEPRRVFFSSSISIDRTSKRLTFLERNGVTKVNSVEECDILCVGKGELKKTGSLVLAVISGKEVITDDWISTSISNGELLDHRSFLARDPTKEAEWKIDLSEAIERGRKGIKPFLNLSFYFTSAAKKDLGKGFTDLKVIAMHAGAKSVQASIPRKPSQLGDKSKTIIIAAQDDGELSALGEAGWSSFNKDIITLSVLRGTVDVESNEFLIHQSNPASSNKRMKRSSVKSR